ncbi:MAG: hypothetical protein MR503_09985 [Oscillospiraceae bacterium]|nr:hypothetical protein [Oscillospiraceae bacterium]
MKRLKHYFPNYILTIILVFAISGLSLISLISGCMLSPSFYISSVEKHGIYQRVIDYTEDYFSKSYAVSSIPAEIYTDGLDEKIVKQAVDGKINSFFDYLSGKTDKIEETEIDFSQLEKNITDFFNEFAEENNVELNDEFNQQLDKTIKAAETDINSFTNIFMLDYIEKAGIPQKIRKVYPVVSPVLYAFIAVTAICIILLILLNKKEIKSFLYWLSVSGLCSAVIMLIPCIMLKSSDYFSRLIMRTDYIYFAVTGLLNDIVDSLMNMQLVILAASAFIMILYIIAAAISGKKEKN